MTLSNFLLFYLSQNWVRVRATAFALSDLTGVPFELFHWNFQCLSRIDWATKWRWEWFCLQFFFAYMVTIMDHFGPNYVIPLYSENLFTIYPKWSTQCTSKRLSSTRKAGFLNVSISINRTYTQTRTHSYNHIRTRICNQTHTNIHAHIYSFSYLYSQSSWHSGSHLHSYVIHTRHTHNHKRVGRKVMLYVHKIYCNGLKNIKNYSI